MAENRLESLKSRLDLELKEIDNQAENDYFLELHEKRTKFPKNENNLLVAHLLGLCEDFDPSSDPKFTQGEFPDIDVDYPPRSRSTSGTTGVPEIGRAHV